MLILLDIDGVMLPAKSWSSPELLEDGFSMFNTKAVRALNNIIDSSNADVLLTTSHKSRYTVEKWKEIFKSRGVRLNNLNKLPDNLENLDRRDEISKWFSTYKLQEDFVIIDDDSSLNGLSIYLKKRLVLTKPLIGLNNPHVQESLDILNTPLVLA